MLEILMVVAVGVLALPLLCVIVIPLVLMPAAVGIDMLQEPGRRLQGAWLLLTACAFLLLGIGLVVDVVVSK